MRGRSGVGQENREGRGMDEGKGFFFDAVGDCPKNVNVVTGDSLISLQEKVEYQKTGNSELQNDKEICEIRYFLESSSFCKVTFSSFLRYPAGDSLRVTALSALPGWHI